MTHQHTWLEIIQKHLFAWQNHENWTRESLAQTIIEYYIQQTKTLNKRDKMGFEAFALPRAGDSKTYKANADRIFRWLDSQSKMTNFLPTNFLPYLLGAMPKDRQLRCLDDLLAQLGFNATPLGEKYSENMNESEQNHALLHDILREIRKENYEAEAALLNLLPKDGTLLANATTQLDYVHDARVLQQTVAEVKESIAVLQKANAALQARLQALQAV